MSSSSASSGTSSGIEKGAAEPNQSRSADAHRTASIIYSEPSGRQHGRLNFQWVLRLNQRAVPALRVLTNWKVEMYIEERRAAGCVSSRDRLYRFLASPTSSGNALMFALLILAVSFASIITFGVESHQHSKQVSSARELFGENATAIEEHLGSLTPPYEEPLFAWNCVLAAMFTADLALRLATYPNPLRDSELWVDALALLPLILRIACVSTPEGDLFYESALEMYLPGQYYQPAGGTFLHLNAAFSSLRLLKLTRHMLGCRILGQTLTESFTALLIPTYFLFMLVTLFGTLLFALEYDPYAELDGPRVLDIPTAWYLILVTMATVGYGDFSPQTAGGKILMGFVMITGLTVMAMPLAIVGNNFGRAWEARELALIAEEIKLRLLWRGRSLHDVLQAFEDFDSDRDGTCSYPEFKQAVTAGMGINLEGRKLRSVWRQFDHDESNSIRYHEFAHALFPELDPQEMAEALRERSQREVVQAIQQQQQRHQKGRRPRGGGKCRWLESATALIAGSPSAEPRPGSPSLALPLDAGEAPRVQQSPNGSSLCEVAKSLASAAADISARQDELHGSVERLIAALGAAEAESAGRGYLPS